LSGFSFVVVFLSSVFFVGWDSCVFWVL